MTEVHIFGDIFGASEFPDHRLFCKWSLHAGDLWRVLEGCKEGQTHLDIPNGNVAYWIHPIDIHLATCGMQGWPRLQFEVWHHDVYSRNELWAYGCCQIPTSPGYYELDCYTWRPLGSVKEQFMSYFLGGGPQLRRPELVHASSELYKLKTVSMGKIHLHLNVIMRNFQKYGIEF